MVNVGFLADNQTFFFAVLYQMSITRLIGKDSTVFMTSRVSTLR